MSKLDMNVKNKLLNRTIQPSASSWERMSEQLDAADKKRRKRLFWYVGYAASILLILSLVFFGTKQDSEKNSIEKD